MLFKSKNIGREVFFGFVLVVICVIIGFAVFDKDSLSNINPIKIFSPSNEVEFEKAEANTEIVPLQADQKDILEILEMPDTSDTQKISQDEITVPIISPTLDVVRIDPQGAVLIAGSAEPFAELTVLIDNMAVFTENVGADGKFVAIFNIEPSDNPRLLMVQSLGAAGDIIASADTILISPFSAPDIDQGVEIAVQKETLSPDNKNAVQKETLSSDNKDLEIAALKIDAGEKPPIGAPKLIKITDSGAQKLTLVPGEKLELALDIITYTDVNTVVFAGKGTPNNTARLYLDGNFLGDALIDENGSWFFESTKIKPKLYMLRIDELGPENNVIMRLATPFLRESQENLLSTILAENSNAGSVEETTMLMQEGESAAENSASVSTQTPRPTLSVITVQAGHTLWGISRAHYGRGALFIQIFEENSDKIKDPNLIYPGQIFTLPN